MTFLQPAAFLAAATVPLILLLYMLRKKTRPQTVSSTMLWERLERTSSPSVKLSRLLKNLLLLMQLLAACLLVTALARPSLLLAGGGGVRRNTIVIVDTSYSMAVEEEGGSRLEQARRFLRDLVNRKGGEEALAVVAMAGKARIVCGLTADKAALRRAVESLAVDGGRADLQAGLVLAQNLAHNLEDPAAVVISDGNCREAAINVGLPISFIPVGRNPVRNLLVTGAVADGQRLYVSVHNNGTVAASGLLQVKNSDGRLIGQREVALEPNEGTTFTWRNLESSPWYAAQLEGGDQVRWDDTFYALNTAADGRRLLLVSEGNLFLERALMLQEGLKITKALPAQYRDELAGRYDYFVFDGFLPASLPAAPVLVFDPPHPNPHFATTPPFRPGHIRTAAHALTAYVDFSEVTLAYAKGLSSGRPLLEAEEGYVAVEMEQQGQPLVVFGFAVQAGNLPLRPAFPILVRNILDYFTGTTALPGRLQYGESLFLDPPYLVNYLEVIFPGGDRRQIAGPFPYRGEALAETGIYTVIAGERSYLAAVNPPVVEESLAARDHINAGGSAVAGDRQLPGGLPLAAPLLMAALMVLGLEWWVDNRGY